MCRKRCGQSPGRLRSGSAPASGGLWLPARTSTWSRPRSPARWRPSPGRSHARSSPRRLPPEPIIDQDHQQGERQHPHLNRIAHGRGRRTEGNPRAPLWDRSPTSAPRPRQPRDGTGSCGSQPAYQSFLDRRLQRRLRPCATFSQALAAELIGRRTLMSYALEKGHESGSTETLGTHA